MDEGYAYAGVEFGSECFCGNEPPPEDTIVDQSECDWTCHGDRELICGALWRMNVFETGEWQKNHATARVVFLVMWSYEDKITSFLQDISFYTYSYFWCSQQQQQQQQQ